MLLKGQAKACLGNIHFLREDVIHVNGFHSPPGKPTFHPPEPTKWMFAHQQNCSHADET